MHSQSFFSHGMEWDVHTAVPGDARAFAAAEKELNSFLRQRLVSAASGTIIMYMQ